MCHQQKGFSLIELLIVMAIIALLMAVLVPGLRMAKEQGRKIACASHLRNFGVALQLYLDGNDNWLPPAEPRDKDDPASQQNWYMNVELMACMNVAPCRDEHDNVTGPPPKRTILTCPSHHRPTMTKQVLPDHPAQERAYALSYMMNGTWRLSNRGGKLGEYRHLSEFRNPQETLALCDGNGYERARGIVFYVACPRYNFEYRHRETINTLFLDTHVSALKQEDVPMDRAKRHTFFWSEKE